MASQADLRRAATPKAKVATAKAIAGGNPNRIQPGSPYGVLMLPRKKAMKAIEVAPGHERSDDVIKTGSGASHASGQKVPRPVDR
jgi:hypothetical protein